MKKIVLSIFSALMLFSACTKTNRDKPGSGQNDLSITVLETSDPITSAEVCGEIYDNVLQWTTGIPLTLKIQFKGNDELAQYKIEIHNNFDCHGHDRPLSEWAYLNIGELSGKNSTVVEEIP